MIRTAISPRLAMRPRRNGRPSLRKDGPWEPPTAAGPSPRRGSERDVAMLLARVDVALVGEELEGRDEPGPRLGRPDDGIDVAARGRGIRTRELDAVFLHQARPLRVGIRGGGDLVLEDDRHGAVRAHDRDLRCGPREVHVAADVLAAHDVIRAAVRLACD